MRLLITTQVVDKHDPNLGFFHAWIEEFARTCEQVTVICLYEGKHALPENVTVYSLGKEQGQRSSLVYAWRFIRYIVRFRSSYDAVFVHMNPEYVVLGGLLWRLWGKRIGMWYAHGAVTVSLRFAILLGHLVFTSTPQGCRIPSRKVHVVGQGIDTTKFVCAHTERDRRQAQDNTVLQLISIGRVSRIKNIDVLIESSSLLLQQGIKSCLHIVGDLSQDAAYTEALHKKALALPQGTIVFHGAVAHDEVVSLLCKSDMLLNVSDTASLDKVILEAMSVGVAVVTSNESGRAVLQEVLSEGCVDTTPRSIAEGIVRVQERRSQDPTSVSESLRTHVIEHHSLSRLVTRIQGLYDNAKR